MIQFIMFFSFIIRSKSTFNLRCRSFSYFHFKSINITNWSITNISYWFRIIIKFIFFVDFRLIYISFITWYRSFIDITELLILETTTVGSRVLLILIVNWNWKFFKLILFYLIVGSGILKLGLVNIDNLIVFLKYINLLIIKFDYRLCVHEFLD